MVNLELPYANIKQQRSLDKARGYPFISLPSLLRQGIPLLRPKDSPETARKQMRKDLNHAGP
jgi:hypothetical protein